MPTSHKSYRPLTILSLRMQRRLGNPILRRIALWHLLVILQHAPLQAWAAP